jgi:hypothetical protein
MITDGPEKLCYHVVRDITRQTTLVSKVVAPRDDRIRDLLFANVGQVIVKHPDRYEAPLNRGGCSSQLALPVNELIDVVHRDRGWR